MYAGSISVDTKKTHTSFQTLLDEFEYLKANFIYFYLSFVPRLLSFKTDCLVNNAKKNFSDFFVVNLILQI